MEGYITQFQKLWQVRTIRLVLVTVALVLAVVSFQNSALSLGTGSSSLLSTFRTPSLANDSTSSVETEVPNVAERSNKSNETEGSGGGDFSDDDTDSGDDDEALDEEFEIDLGNGAVLKKAKDGYITIERADGNVVGKGGKKAGDGFISASKNATNSTGLNPDETGRTFNSPPPPFPTISNSSDAIKPPAPKREEEVLLQTYSISDMNRILLRNRANPQGSMAPLWPSPVDQHILDAKAQIENAPLVNDDPELYAPAFRNVSMFRRSYELMEQTLKVYVYKEGERPIFHKPFFTGIYASEGWFMKHMEENTRFVADDPNKAHLFYIPFSSRTLKAVLYVANSHSHKNLIGRLGTYVKTISERYPFWNRTGGADHFLAACHDWATHETGMSMETTIRALCNADVREGFQLGKDVSLPETFVRSGGDPLRGIGGKPARKRTTLAFFSGQMHGYLRPILLRHWENKDPDMKIFGPLRSFGSVKASFGSVKARGKNRKKERRRKRVERINMYIDYMKDSKYCICPRGYEVNSPRVVEAIFYECVPVIISDNFVPPFFEVLNWEAFSVILPEKDVPRLKEILASIPRRKYERLQMGVRRVQKHFLWNRSPVRYDLFHMILHSVWLNRVYQLRVG